MAEGEQYELLPAISILEKLKLRFAFKNASKRTGMPLMLLG